MEQWVIDTITYGCTPTKAMELLYFYFREGVRGKIHDDTYLISEAIDIIHRIARGDQVTPAYLRARARRVARNMWASGYVDPDPVDIAVELDPALPVPDSENLAAPAPRIRRQARGANARTRAKYAELLKQKEIKAGCLTPTPTPKPTQPTLW